MKKTNIRVHRKGGSKTVRSQVPNKPETAQQAVASLTLVDHRDTSGKWLALTEFTLSELEGTKSCAARSGESLAQFLESAIKQKMAACAAPNQPPPAKPWWHDDSKLQQLILGNEKAEVNMWASPEGFLFLWDGDLDREPQVISYYEARAWWEKFYDPEWAFAAPYFKEATPAARLVTEVCDEFKKREAETARKIAPPNLEDSVRASVALTVLMQERMCYSETLVFGEEMKGYFDAGLCVLTGRVNDDLLKAFYGRKGGVQ